MCLIAVSVRLCLTVFWGFCALYHPTCYCFTSSDRRGEDNEQSWFVYLLQV